MNLDEACAFLSDISSIPASLIRTDKDLNAFCDRYFFHRSQNPFKVSYLNSLIEETKNDTILFIQDAFLIKFVIIKTKDDLILFGPYILQDMTEAMYRAVCVRWFCCKTISAIYSHQHW